MTTLDDAAERLVRELSLEAANQQTRDNRLRVGDGSSRIADAMRLLWIEATEAAAKKCEAEQKPRASMVEDADHAYNNGCRDCAMAIRGKGG